MKKSLSLILALAMVFTMFASVAFAAEPTTEAAATTSVTAATYTPQQAFDLLKEKGIVEGDAVKGANLEANMTRAEFAKVISKLWALPENAAGSTVYSDLVGAGWAAGYIGAATKAGLLNGVGGGKFNPSGNVKLEEIAKVVAVGFKLPAVAYSGTGKVSTWAKGYVGAVVGAKLVADSADFTVAAKRSQLFTIGYTGYVALAAMTTPTPTPVAASKGLDLSSAVALNSKVVEVTLATAAVAADLTVANVTAKTGTTALVVSSVAAAPYATDGKTVLVTLAADTAVGTLYTLTSGTKSVNFGGRAVDTAKPTVTGILVNEYNEIELTFSEAIKLDGLVVTSAEAYGTKTVLNTSNFVYNGSNKVKVTTDAQKAVLYTLAISGYSDFAGNKADADNAKTFVGLVKPTAAFTSFTTTAVDSKKVKVTFDQKVDATTSLDKSKYAIALTYGAKTAVVVSAVAADATDAKTVVLTLETDTVAQLYTVTVSAGVSTKYGVATTAALTGTFVGEIADVVALASPVAASTNNTTITVTFGSSTVKDAVDAATKADQFTITEAYGAKAALAISAISITNNVVTLTTAAQSGVLYNVTVKAGIKDAKGNATTADLSTTVVGSLVKAKISSITSALLDSTGTLLTVVFGGDVGATATDVSHYTIDNSVGYPTKAVKGTLANTVILTVPVTTAGKLYILTVKGLENSDGVAMDAAGVTKTFVGVGAATAAKPVIQAVIATDKQTLTIYFDRDVTDSSIKGASKIWNNNSLVTGSLALKAASAFNSSTGTKNLDAYTAYVSQDATNKNVLVVRINTEDFVDANKRTDGTLAIVAANGLLATDAVVTPFSPTTTAISKISISNIMATSKNSIRVYFSQPVEVTNGFAKVATVSTMTYATANITLSNAVAVDATNTVFDFKLSSNLSASTAYWLVALEAGTIATIHDYTADANAGYVTLTDSDSVAANVQNVSQFAGSGTDAPTITSAQVVYTNKKTLEIYFPQAVDATTATNKANYTLFTAATAGTELGSGFFNTNVVASAYDAATNKVTFTLSAFLPTSTSGVYYIEFNPAILNAVGNANVQTSATNVTPIRQQVVAGTVDAPKVTVTSVTYATYQITINLSQDITNVVAVNGSDLDNYFTISINSGGHTIVDADVTNVTQTASKLVVTITTPVTAGGVGTVTAKAALTGLNAEAGDTASSASFSQ